MFLQIILNQAWFPSTSTCYLHFASFIFYFKAATSEKPVKAISWNMAVRLKKRQTNREKYFYERPPRGQNTSFNEMFSEKYSFFTDLLPTCIGGIFHFWCFPSTNNHVKHHILIHNIYTVSTQAETTYTYSLMDWTALMRPTPAVLMSHSITEPHGGPRLEPCQRSLPRTLTYGSRFTSGAMFAGNSCKRGNKDRTAE